MAEDSKNPKEIVNLNKALMSFDVADMGTEELEFRFELATMTSVSNSLGNEICVAVCGANCATFCLQDSLTAG